MSPAALGIWVAAVLGIDLVTTNPLVRGLLLLLVLNRLVSQSLPGRRLRPLLTGVGIAAAVSLLLTTLLSHSGEHVIAQLPGWLPGIGGRITLESVAFGATAGLGLAVAILATATLGTLCEPHEVVDALPGALRRTATAVSGALSLAPSLARNARAIAEAQRMRGWRPRRLREWRHVAVPVVLSSIEDSLQLAEAMEVRGFGSGPRTRYRQVQTSGADLLAAVLAIAAACLVAAVRISGSQPDWYPFPTFTIPALPLDFVVALALLLPPVLRWTTPRSA